MSNESNLDESAIRAQIDAHLEKMGNASLGPEGGAGGGEPRRSKKGGGHGGGHHAAPAHDVPHFAKGTVTAIDGTKVLVELGPKSHGQLSIDEFDDPPKPGDEFEFSLVSIQDGMWLLSRKEARTLATWKDLERGRIVKATVIGENSGGLELKIGPVSAFMPASEIDTKRVENFHEYLNQTFVCEVVEADMKRKRVVLSRRAVLARERREARDRTFDTIKVGQVMKGKVDKLEAFGAFVDLGNGCSGLLHVSNISHQRIDDPSKVLTVGQELEVQVLEIKGGKKIGLGLKQLQADPWDSVAQRHRPGTVLTGKVARLMDFGAFVEVEPGIEGLVHRSALTTDRVVKISDIVKVGDAITVRVVSVDAKQRRIALSRLTDRGHLIGSEEDLGTEEIARYAHKGDQPSSGTNLGALLREAMAKKQKP